MFVSLHTNPIFSLLVPTFLLLKSTLLVIGGGEQNICNYVFFGKNIMCIFINTLNTNLRVPTRYTLMISLPASWKDINKKIAKENLISEKKSFSQKILNLSFFITCLNSKLCLVIDVALFQKVLDASGFPK